jgi:uncharacterized protein (TIGR03083 family)
VEHEEFIDALRREGEALGEVRLVDVDVPTCPEWSLPELVHHVGSVHRWQEAQLRSDDPADLVKVERAERPPLNALSGWYRAGLASLLDAFAEVGPHRVTPTWFGPRPATFWARRAAHETAIHRWDAEAAVTTPQPLDARQAVDALDELLEVFAPRRFDPTTWTGPDVSIHLHATDTEGEWTIRLGSSGLDVGHEHAKGDVAARGSASDLVLMIAGRVPPARLELFGDAAVIDRWHRAVPI